MELHLQGNKISKDLANKLNAFSINEKLKIYI